MLPPVQLLPGSISEILVAASETGQITTADRYGLLAAVCDESLPEEDMRAINRLLRAIRKGKVKVVDQLF